MSFEELQDGHHGSHLECRNGTNLAVLNFNDSRMPPTKFQLNLTYRLGADVVSRFSSWLPWRPSWILKRNEFGNSKSQCHPNASHHVCNLTYHSIADAVRTFSRWPPQQPSWISERNVFNNLNLYVAPMPPIKFQLNPTYSLGGYHLKTFKTADMTAILDIGTDWF